MLITIPFITSKSDGSSIMQRNSDSCASSGLQSMLQCSGKRANRQRHQRGRGWQKGLSAQLLSRPVGQSKDEQRQRLWTQPPGSV